MPLTKGYEAVIDAADAGIVGAHNWHAIVGRNTVYAACSIFTSGKWSRSYLHRFLTDPPKGIEVDHINRNGMDNRRSNLRCATRSQNACNQRLNRGNSVGLKGVSWHGGVGRFRAYIRLNGHQKHLGYFDCPESAHKAYCAASVEMHGEWGRAK